MGLHPRNPDATHRRDADPDNLANLARSHLLAARASKRIGCNVKDILDIFAVSLTTNREAWAMEPPWKRMRWGLRSPETVPDPTPDTA